MSLMTPSQASARAGTPDAAARLRFVTAASLFDGHDASINIMRRILQAEGAEVIHLGHDRSVADIVKAAVEEDVHAVAVSSYQGGHMEFFTYMVELLREQGRPEISVFGGGGGTITDKEIAELEARGVAKIYSVEDGRRLGLRGMIRDMMQRAARPLLDEPAALPPGLYERRPKDVARALSLIEELHLAGSEQSLARLAELRAELKARTEGLSAPVVGITGTGGAGKSSLTDELLRRMLERYPDRFFAVLSVDPSRRRTGGALLGDRIRMNSLSTDRAYMRSMATRQAHAAVSPAVADSLLALRAAGFDLVLFETAGIGQSGSEVVDLANVSLYVMTPEYGAPSQLEKIDMLDFADMVAINKADKRGAHDARQFVAKQVQRNRGRFGQPLDQMPVFLCVASQYGDAGCDRLFQHLMRTVGERAAEDWDPGPLQDRASRLATVIPGNRVRYLAEIAEVVRGYKRLGLEQAHSAHRADGVRRALEELGDPVPPIAEPYPVAELDDPLAEEGVRRLRQRYNAALARLGPHARELLREMPRLRASYTARESSYSVRGQSIRAENYSETLSGTRVPKVSLPSSDDWATLLRWRWLENVPGRFPFTAGVFPYKRRGEDPTRMFAGEGPPERTNRRFHFLSQGQPAARLSTAFDSVTLYGRDPDPRPDIYGKVGNSGVSVATLDDAKRLYSGFDLLSPSTSVSMTINGPAPMILAMFLNTAVDQAVERHLRSAGRWEQAEARLGEILPDRPRYRSTELPPGHDGSGLGLLGASGRDLVEAGVLGAEEHERIRAHTLSRVRGTVQADILKEDQAQNTCIFSTDFALKMMGDIQSYFIENKVRNFYSVSISGYHIAEAGANPISQLAFTLANGFTFVEYYRARGLSVDEFAQNLSFFFSNGIDPEYSVIGRVARRIWAVAMRELYGASERSQQLKYHIQTSGRSLHAQEIAFNDIRTTLQALYAVADNCNSLHTNAYDEAITTPTEESVRRALAIQLILNKEFGLLKNENPLQGSFFVEQLTEIVEEAVLAEFERLSERGGVLGAMELMYQRSKIQEESLLYEEKKHSGELPIVGINTFVDPKRVGGVQEVELARSSDEEKRLQIEGLAQFHARNGTRAPQALERLKKAAHEGGNVFAELMETVRVASLGQITQALFEVGGQYRRSM
jgi:isobutyryl-CoA mutase